MRILFRGLLPVVPALLVIGVCGCSLARTIYSNRADLQADIRNGTAVSTGDRVRVTRANGDIVILTVTALDQASLSGNQAHYVPDRSAWSTTENPATDPDPATVLTIPIDSIAGLQNTEQYAAQEPSDMSHALMLAAYGFLIVFAWAVL